MKKSLSLVLAMMLLLTSAFVLISCDGGRDEDTITIRNLYFSDWAGGDAYTSYIEEKFNVKISPTSYSWADWDSQVYTPIQSNQLTDVFHFSLDNYNFSNSYVEWVNGDVIKPLPDDLSRWPNVKKMIEGINNIENLKINGKLYCIPVAKNIKEAETNYSPFTYVYRRDWAKELGVYQEGDVYTWEQFQALLDKFYKEKYLKTNSEIAAIADVEWGFPSITNFYKDAPHCYSIDENGKVVSTYTTDGYLTGLNLARDWASGSKKYYGYDQYTAKDGDVAKRYYAGKVGVFYENLSLSNYTTLRRNVLKNLSDKSKLDDATAILKVMGPDGKYALEGTDNWFSATFFSSDISDAKQEKILDIMDWLLSDEGTEMAAFGFEGYDYEKDANGNVTLLEAGWEKDADGNYIEKFNGAKYLRYMCTLGYDMNSYDPMVDQKALSILNDWYSFMNEQNAQGNLRVLVEDSDVKWLTTTLKAKNSGGLLDKATTSVVEYVYGKTNLNDYLTAFDTTLWRDVLQEINSELGK